MSTTFYIVEDDEVIQDTLVKVIAQNELGTVLGATDNGMTAIEDLARLQPDIVLLDLLLPKKDGINIVSHLKSMGVSSYFIMISQVTSPEMIAKAYQEGIEFFIDKPINLIEVITVIEKVKEKIQMAQVIQSFENALKSMELYKKPQKSGIKPEVATKKSIELILAQLGITGDAGTGDITEIILYLLNKNDSNDRGYYDYRTSELYQYLCDMYQEQYDKTLNVSAIEQRIRRTIFKALNNIATIGLEDYNHEIFSRFSSSLFEFKEVRAQMNYISEKSYEKGKINVKKFIEGIMLSIKDY